MTYKELYNYREEKISNISYKCMHWSEFDYSILKYICYRVRSGKGNKITYNDIIIMADTETSKKPDNEENHIVAWTISARAFNKNLFTVYGHRPSSMMTCIDFIVNNMSGEKTVFYFHNMSYDYVFLRKFLFDAFGYPAKQLNTKPHYPILLEFENGVTLKDSLILAQRSLDKWAKDLDVEHKKALGKWDYNKYRTQFEEFTNDEIEYIEHDTLAGVECIQKTMDTLNKNIMTIPYTATGIPREEVRKRSKANKGRRLFLSQVPDYVQYRKLEHVYHGGYTHANRWIVDTTITADREGFGEVKCKDFTSSYPYAMLAFKYPCERFMPIGECEVSYIVDRAQNYGFMFKLILLDVELKDLSFPMPALQFSKCLNTINPVLDNGRILQANFVEIYLNEMDLLVINEQYKWKKALCIDVEVAEKDYLPRWFTDYVFECFTAKTMLKGGDPVLYSIAKAKVNSLYGLSVQKCIKDNLIEDFTTGEYKIAYEDPEEVYTKYVENHNSVLPYTYGCWVTSYAFYNLFQLGKCCETWLYSDTDSCYGCGWDEEKVAAYNEHCKELLQANGYGAVEHNNREYWLGIAESDGDKDTYTEFRVLGAKRYCGRCKADGEIHITVAGVPKIGAKCLKDNINNFTAGMIFDGETTGKLLHTHIYVDDIYIDDAGNETGDSINLSPCDYLLDSITITDFDSLFIEEIEVQMYE